MIEVGRFCKVTGYSAAELGRMDAVEVEKLLLTHRTWLAADAEAQAKAKK